MYIGMSGRGQGRSRGRGRPPGRARGGRGGRGAHSSNASQSSNQDQEPPVVRGRGRPRKQPDANGNASQENPQAGRLDEIDPGLGTSRGPCAPALSHPLIPQYESEESDDESDEDVLHGAVIEEPSSESESEDDTDQSQGPVRPRKDRLINDLQSALQPENYNR